MVATPASTSAWQLPQSSTHFRASARMLTSDLLNPPKERWNSLASGSRWWNCNAAIAAGVAAEHALAAGLLY